MNNKLLKGKPLKDLKSINVVGLKKLTKEYYKESIILNNSDLKKPKENTFNYSASGCFYNIFNDEYTYESMVIDLYKLEQIIGSL